MSDQHDSAQQVPTREKVLVVGAGPAGLAAAAALTALQVPFDLVDSAAHVGGIWDPERKDSPVWRSMEMISSREFTQYEDMIQPVSFPEFLRPEQMGKYLRAYASRYNLTEHFRPRTTVRRAASFEEGTWQVELSTGEINVYRAIIAAQGTSSRPHLPAWADEVPASTTAFHSSQWEGSDGLESKRVLVVGSGQSAADIAVDAARRALEVRWSVRTGHWIVPRRIGPLSGEALASREPTLLKGFNKRLATFVVGRTAGDPASVGLPKPKLPVTEDRVIVSDTVMDRIREGRITPTGDVTGIGADGAVQGEGLDGYVPDLIIFATGYECGSNFLPEDVIPPTANGTPDLFLGAFPRHRDDLAILGQVQVSGGVLPVLVQQADIAALMIKASIDGDSRLEEFQRLRERGEAGVPGTAARGGVRGTLASAVGSGRGADREGSAGRSAQRLVPFADREQLLARLRTARKTLEG